MRVVHALSGNTQWLDGGAMFGNVPRALWSRWCPADEHGRIQLACRSLLVDEGARKVLLEAGIGTFFEPRLKERYGVVESRHVLLESLQGRGLSAGDIDVIVLSHLHFDHAGGLLAPWREGGRLELLFPNAWFVVGSEAMERAKKPHTRDRASFVPGLLELLETSGRLVVVRDERCELLGDSYRFRRTFGHTPGMLHATVYGECTAIFFCADLVPGVPWVHVPVTMGYDRYPERLIDEKREVFEAIHGTPTWLFFTHDPRVAAAQLARNSDGRYRTIDERSDFGPGLDLDTGGT